MATISKETARAELARRDALRGLARTEIARQDSVADMWGQSVPGQQAQYPDVSTTDPFGRAVQVATRQTHAEPSPGSPDAPPGYSESLTRGIAQGATFGFADELEGASKALGMEPGKLLMSLLAGPAGPAVYASYASPLKAATSPSDIPTTIENAPDEYRSARDAARQRNDYAEQANPKTYLAGNVAGALATAMVPGAAPARGAAAAAKIAALSGAASGLGSSKADVTKGDVAGALEDTAIGGAIGLGTGVATYGLGRGINSVMRRARGAEGAAKSVAAEAALRSGDLEQASQVGTRRSFFDTSMDLEKHALETTGENLNLRPGQSTGDPALALAEMKARNFPETMAAAQQLENAQLATSAKYLDMMVDKVSEKPELLGKEGVGKRLAESLDNYIAKLRDIRSKKADPLYAQFRELAGEVKLPTSNTVSVLEREISEMGKGAGKEASSKLHQTLGVLKDGASLEDIAAERRFWSGASQSSGTTLDQLAVANKTRIARDILSAIDADMANAEQLGSGGAWAALKKANAVYAKHSRAIEEAATDTVERVLKVSTGDAADTIPAKLFASSPQQIAGVFEVLNKADPAMAKVVRAQMLDDILTSAGKPMRPITVGGNQYGSVAAQEGVARLKPGEALSALAKPANEAKLIAAFAGDDKAMFALRRSLQLLKRISFGPGIKGSSTAPLLAQVAKEAEGQVIDLAAAASGGGAVGKAVGTAGRFILGLLGDDKALNQIYSSGHGIQLFNEALQAQLNGQAIKAPTLNALMAISNLAGSKAEDARDMVTTNE